MKFYERILVALSGTPHDAALLRYVRTLSELGIVRQIEFLHVIQEGALPLTAIKAEQDVTNSIHRHFGNSTEGIETQLHVLRGIRTDVVLELSSSLKADLIVLGHRKERSGHRSLARRLAMVAPCSVWLIPEDAPGTMNRILAPVDFSDNSADALEMAAFIASKAKTQECLALHVAFDPIVVGYDEHAEQMHFDEKAKFQEFLAPIERHGMEVKTACEDGPDPAKTILRIASERSMDLIVLNTRGRSRAAAVLLGSVTARVLSQSPIAILIVKHSGAMMGLFEVLQDRSFWTAPNPKMN
jgi:SulP family sulfate permease